MSTLLFRQEALQATSEQHGVPVALMPWSWWALTGFFVACAAGTLIFLATATFPRKETATGILRYPLGELRIAPPRSGILKAAFVRDGQDVVAGDVLAFVTTEQRMAEGDVYDARVLAAIGREREMLESRLAALNASEPLQTQALRERIAGIGEQLTELRGSSRNRTARAQLATESYEAAAALAAQGVYSAEQRRVRQQQALALGQGVSELASQIISLESQRTDLALQLARLPAEVAQTRAGVLGAIEALEEKRASAAAQNGFSLIASTAGTVTSLQAQVGQPVDPAKPLMTLIPQGSVLQAELYVPSRAIAFVGEGQPVRLLFDAFPYTRFGPGRGRVAQVASAVLRPEEVTAAVKVGEPVYKVLVSLDTTAMQAYGKAIPLQSGMALTADILLESRSFLDLLMDPLLAARARVLGE